MKVHNIAAAAGTMAQIASMGAMPIAKAPIKEVGTDAQLNATVLAAEVLAKMRQETTGWHGFAKRVILLPVDGRKAFVDAVRKDLTQMRKDNAAIHAPINKDGKAEPSKDQTKLAGQNVSTAAVQVSRLTTIAKAWNAGATDAGLFDFAGGKGGKPDSLDQVGFVVIYNYAKMFSASAAGRKPDPFLVKLSKWLEKNKPSAEDDDEMAFYNAVVVTYNGLAEAAAK